MFSLRHPAHSTVFYIEWIVFAVLLATLVALWWILATGSLPRNRSTPSSIPTPDQVMQQLLYGTTTPQMIPEVVIRNLSAQAASARTKNPAGDTASTSGIIPTDTYRQLRTCSQSHRENDNNNACRPKQ